MSRHRQQLKRDLAEATAAKAARTLRLTIAAGVVDGTIPPVLADAWTTALRREARS